MKLNLKVCVCVSVKDISEMKPIEFTREQKQIIGWTNGFGWQKLIYQFEWLNSAYKWMNEWINWINCIANLPIHSIKLSQKWTIIAPHLEGYIKRKIDIFCSLFSIDAFEFMIIMCVNEWLYSHTCTQLIEMCSVFILKFSIHIFSMFINWSNQNIVKCMYCIHVSGVRVSVV